MGAQARITGITCGGQQEVAQGDAGLLAFARSVVLVGCHVNFSRGIQGPFG
jgi:hypothetical protein